MTNPEIDKIIFSDGYKFNLYRFHGKSWVRRKQGERINNKIIHPRLKFGGGNIMVYGCISSKGTGNLVFIEGTVNVVGYKNILSNNLLQSAKNGVETLLLYAR